MRALEDQVRVEFEASLQYILMATHFDQVRPGPVEEGVSSWCRRGEGPRHPVPEGLIAAFQLQTLCCLS